MRRERRPRVRADALEHGVEVRALHLERRPQGGELVQQTPEAPHVAAPVVGLALDHLGRHVVGRADFGVDGDGVGAELPAEAEVRHLAPAVRGDEDVRGFNVAVHDAALVHVRERGGDLPEGSPDGSLVEEGARGEMLAEEALEVAARGPLEDDAELLVVEERIVHLHDARVPQVAEELHLAQAPQTLPLAHLVQVHLLDGHPRAVVSSSALVHHGVSALAHRPPDLVHLPKIGHGPALDRGELERAAGVRRVAVNAVRRAGGYGFARPSRLGGGRAPVRHQGLALASRHDSTASAIVSMTSWSPRTAYEPARRVARCSGNCETGEGR